MIHPQPPHADAIRRAVMAAYGRNDAVLNAHPYIEDRSGYVGTARPRRIAGSGSFLQTRRPAPGPQIDLDALQAALASGKPAVVEIPIDLEELSTPATPFAGSPWRSLVG